MYLDEKHNILMLEDKDYDSRHDIKSFLFLVNATIKNLNPHSQKFLIKADLTKIRKIDMVSILNCGLLKIIFIMEIIINCFLLNPKKNLNCI